MLLCAARLPDAPASPSCRSHRPAVEIDSAKPPETRYEKRRESKSNLLDSKAYHTSLDVEGTSYRYVSYVYFALLATLRPWFRSATVSPVPFGCFNVSDSQCSCRRPSDSRGRETVIVFGKRSANSFRCMAEYDNLSFRVADQSVVVTTLSTLTSMQHNSRHECSDILSHCHFTA